MSLPLPVSRRAALAHPLPEAAFGSYLRLLRRRARLTQAELGIAVGYSDAQICRLETGRRPPDLATLVALFLPALSLEPTASEARQLLALAAMARADHLNEGEPATPPPAPSTDYPPTIIGREAERRLLTEGLRSNAVRLFTILGPAGVGKTHLAQHMNQELQNAFANGACWVELASLDDPALVAPAILQALHVSEEGHADAVAALRSTLRERHMLLVLDNFEQVRGAAPLLAELLRSAPRLSLLVTSRVALRLQAEHVLTLAPLAVPDLANLPGLTELALVPAVALLLARLRTTSPELRLTEANALTLATLCVRVDGMPLALELVAAQGRLFAPRELLSEVAQQFVHMRRSGSQVPAHHRSLATALRWSYEQLAPAVQRLFARLGSFANGWTVEAMVAACDLEGQGRAELLAGLESLLDHSLIQRHVDDEHSRFAMLAMVREFALARLAERDEVPAMHSRLLDYWVGFAAQARQQLGFSAEQAAASKRLFAESDNLRTSLAWALEQGEHERGMQLVGSLARYWYLRGYLREGRTWIERLLALPGQASAGVQAAALDGLGLLAWRQGDYQQAEGWFEQALVLYRQGGDQQGEANVLSHLGLVCSERDKPEQTVRYYEQSLALYKALDDRLGMVTNLHNLGNFAVQRNQNQRAAALYAECLPLYEAIGDQSGLAMISLGLGVIARDEGELAGAESHFMHSLTLARQLGDRWAEATALINLCAVATDSGAYPQARAYGGEALVLYEQVGDQQSVSTAQVRLGLIELAAGELPAAATRFRQSLLLANGIGFQPGIIDALEGLAGCMAGSQPLRAARLLAAAAQQRKLIDMPMALADEPLYGRVLITAQVAANAAQWQAAWAEGESWSLAQAVGLALTN
jgi:predicted ATPase/transcriptional regulator with XRE-family HTH domain